jgi:hypothetical protein
MITRKARELECYRAGEWAGCSQRWTWTARRGCATSWTTRTRLFCLPNPTPSTSDLSTLKGSDLPSPGWKPREGSPPIPIAPKGRRILPARVGRPSAEYPDNRYVVTCRAAAWKGQLPDFGTYEVQPFTPDDIRIRLTLGFASEQAGPVGPGGVV